MDFATDIPLRTLIPPLGQKGLLSHTSPVLTLGSCFSDNIGNRLRTDLFDVVANPFGPLFNPVSVAAALERILDNHAFTESDLQCNAAGEWFCFDLYTGFTSVNQEKILTKANSSLAEARRILTCGQSPLVVITFGTAFTFTLAGCPGRVVANCHKLPRQMFVRSRLEVDEIVVMWSHLLQRLYDFNPDIRVVMTVSPVRHLADGAHGNALSKSLLLLASEKLADSGAIYYPAYEILLDDLRDYRFYAADMAHPSEIAADYIYSHFLQSFCSSDELALVKKCRSLSQRFHHRPISDNPEAYSAFLHKSVEYARKLTEQHPSVSLSVAKLLDSVPQLSLNEL